VIKASLYSISTTPELCTSNKVNIVAGALNPLVERIADEFTAKSLKAYVVNGRAVGHKVTKLLSKTKVLNNVHAIVRGICTGLSTKSLW